jgi:hypothetical protein
MIAASLKEAGRSGPAALTGPPADSVPWGAALAALLSSSQDALLSSSQDALLRLVLPTAPTWRDLSALRIPLWLRSDAALAALVERIGAAA